MSAQDTIEYQALVAEFMAEDGQTATLTSPGQAGYGSASVGARAAQTWSVRAIVLPLDLAQRSGNAALTQATGMLAVESLTQRPQPGWEVTIGTRVFRIVDVQALVSMTTDVAYLCAVQEGTA